uniref:Sodium-coupled neutral amino acid transporter 7 n=1 Tax=Fundulus heteroclitus TaxID=8078 RepID=A0A3Q2NY91_FUNHE
MAINTNIEDWGGVGSSDSGERAWLLQSPSVDSARHPEEDERSQGVSPLAAVFIVVNAALGAGLLNFPAAFNMAGGVMAGVILQMFMLIFIISGLVILGYCSQVCLFFILMRSTCHAACTATTNLKFIRPSQMIAAAAHETDGSPEGHWYTDRKFTIVVPAVLVILPLSIPKEISFQKYASALSVMGTWYVTVVVIVKYIWPNKDMNPDHGPAASASWTAVFNAMPTICFGFQCHVSCVPVFNSMRTKAIKPWGLVVTLSMIICLFVYTGTGVCGFLTFGSSVNQDVLMSYPPDDVAVAIARAFIVVCVVTSYPILHFCGRAVIEGLWLRFRGEQVEVCVRRERRRRILQTLVWFVVTLVLALFIPDIGRVISLIGGLAACFIFVFPGLCLMQAKLSETDSRSTSWHGLVILGIAMVTLGAFIFGLTTSNSIYQDVVN